MEFTENVNFESGGHLYVTASENGGKLTKGTLHRVTNGHIKHCCFEIHHAL